MQDLAQRGSMFCCDWGINPPRKPNTEINIEIESRVTPNISDPGNRNLHISLHVEKQLQTSQADSAPSKPVT
jgi:hypothetical protein